MDSWLSFPDSPDHISWLTMKLVPGQILFIAFWSFYEKKAKFFLQGIKVL